MIKCVTGEWPYTIVALVGDKALNSTHGKRHFQLKRVTQAAFLAETTLQYIACTAEIAEVHCQQWAEQKIFSGEQAVKDFAFQVCLYPRTVTCARLESLGIRLMPCACLLHCRFQACCTHSFFTYNTLFPHSSARYKKHSSLVVLARTLCFLSPTPE